ncbi:hypothetical protein NM208_g13987 [Fusarium decemcellulare]|uniref:Uncharacterized protein n=1 Tax=Fusarium decemcellulare TaxID=57161 RepID=A0ACC1RJL4_9HYPO|nr:hypothetical protein NM208_g13987 [Fusarium decemcellulare]
MLNQLGLPSNPADVSKFFPPSAPQTITLAVFLNSLADALAALSDSAELLSAFSAFDNDDSGQVDLAELRNALLETAPEPGERALTSMEVDKIMNGFTGRRAFNRNMNAQLGSKRGEVFKYQDFVNSIMGSNNGSEAQPPKSSGPWFEAMHQPAIAECFTQLTLVNFVNIRQEFARQVAPEIATNQTDITADTAFKHGVVAVVVEDGSTDVDVCGDAEPG